MHEMNSNNNHIISYSCIHKHMKYVQAYRRYTVVGFCCWMCFCSNSHLPNSGEFRIKQEHISPIAPLILKIFKFKSFATVQSRLKLFSIGFFFKSEAQQREYYLLEHFFGACIIQSSGLEEIVSSSGLAVQWNKNRCYFPIPKILPTLLHPSQNPNSATQINPGSAYTYRPTACFNTFRRLKLKYKS